MFALFCFSNSWALSYEDISVKNKVRSLSSYKSYLIFERKKREFEKNQERLLRLREQNLKLKEERKSNQNKAYLLDFLNNVQAKELKTDLKKLKSLSGQERAFFAYQNQQKIFERQRIEAFLDYKEDYKKYQERQKQILSLRLKSVSALRDEEADNKIPVF
ncbi:MAG: hypothetical protein OXJ52_03500 [Oligoflexia bacterium]|nr:hypothetical protein [Oligoflexia bacterium]